MILLAIILTGCTSMFAIGSVLINAERKKIKEN